MNRRIVFVFILILTACTTGIKPRSETIARIGTMNTLHLGWGHKNFAILASSLTNLDVAGVVEVMNERGISNLTAELKKQSGVDWEYHISEKAVGNGRYKEYCGFVWQTAKCVYLTNEGFYREKHNEFSREPYAVEFKLGDFDFTFVLVHLVFGKNKKGRILEAANLDKVYHYFQERNGSEQDVLIGGDFNLSAGERVFSDLRSSCDDLIDVLSPKTKTTIGSKGFVSAYDHIFITKFSHEYTGRSGRIDFTRGRYVYMRKHVSDHVPVYIEVDRTRDDD